MIDAKNSAVFMSKNIVWATPQTLFDQLNKQYSFTLDVCAIEENTKCKKFFSPEDDGLAQSWSGSCWMNPPYGKTISKWMKKAFDEATTNPDVTSVVCLIPSRTDAKYFQNIVFPNAKQICFVKGRLKFGDSKNSAPFPSVIVVFSKNNNVDITELKHIGYWVSQ